MKLLRTISAVALACLGTTAVAADGLVAVKSPHGAKATMDRLEAQAKKRGLNVFLRLDHAAGAAIVGKTLRPTELLVFGNPQGGTPLEGAGGHCGSHRGARLSFRQEHGTGGHATGDRKGYLRGLNVTASTDGRISRQVP